MFDEICKKLGFDPFNHIFEYEMPETEDDTNAPGPLSILTREETDYLNSISTDYKYVVKDKRGNVVMSNI